MLKAIIILSGCRRACSYTESIMSSARLDFVPLVRLRLNPDGEELRAQVASLDLVEVEIAGAGVLREIEILVHEVGRVCRRACR